MRDAATRRQYTTNTPSLLTTTMVVVIVVVVGSVIAFSHGEAYARVTSFSFATDSTRDVAYTEGEPGEERVCLDACTISFFLSPSQSLSLSLSLSPTVLSPALATPLNVLPGVSGSLLRRLNRSFSFPCSSLSRKPVLV